MKKTSIEPAMTIVNVQIESLMEVISYGGTADNVQGDARGGSSWDDED